jgi:hypothetical protein
MTNNQKINTLKKHFGSLATLAGNNLQISKNIIKDATDGELSELSKVDIKFLSAMAIIELKRRNS